MKGAFWALVSLQVLLLAGIIFSHHYWLENGELIRLRTEPVDPRDLFRGDYVRLSYEISTLDLDRLDGDDIFERNENVYVVLRRDADGTWRPTATYAVMPRGERFIKGRVLSRTDGTRWEVTVRDDAGRRHFLEPASFNHAEGERLHFCISPRNRVIAFGTYSGCGDRRWRPLAATVEEVREIHFNRIDVEYGIESYFVEEGRGKAIEAARNARDLEVQVALRRDGAGLVTALFMDGIQVK